MKKEESKNHLQKFSDGGFKMANDEPNVIGWNVTSEKGIILGAVGDLFFDNQSKMVRYLEIWARRSDEEMSTFPTLIPIGIIQLNEKNQEVIIPGLTTQKTRSLPEYNREEISIEYENKVRASFEDFGDSSTSLPKNDVNDF